MRKFTRLLLLALVFALVIPSITSSCSAESLVDYYNNKVKPLMDDIGTQMKKKITTSSAMKTAFNTAKDAVEELDEACSTVSLYSKDATLMNYLSQVKTYISNGYDRLKGTISTSDSTLKTYQHNAATYLEKFKSRIEDLNDLYGNDIPGDANNDDTVTIADAVLILKYKAGYSVTINTFNADANSDDSINAKDVLLVLQHVAGWDTALE